MRRFLPLLLMASFLLTMVVVGTTHLAGGIAGKQNPKSIRILTVYATIPVEQVSVLAQDFEKIFNIQVNLVILTEQELRNRLRIEVDDPKADLIITSRQSLEQVRVGQLLQPSSSEQTDIIPNRFKDNDDFWVGLWIDPIVFAANQDYVRKSSSLPTKWSDLAKEPKLRLAITDFFAAEASANLLYTLVAVQGEEQTFNYLKKLHPQIVQYAKFLATPVRMAGMGEADVAIAVQSETLRYVKEGFPIQIIYPEEGTAYMLIGAGLVKGASHSIEAKQFLDWLLHENAQKVLEKNRFFLISTNPETTQYKNLTSNSIKLFEKEANYTPEQRQKIVDTWMQTVRFGK